jgi:hypothetical protein
MWSLTFREEHKLQILENKVIMKICGPKKDEMSNLGCYIKMSLIIVRWIGHMLKIPKKRNA